MPGGSPSSTWLVGRVCNPRAHITTHDDHPHDIELNFQTRFPVSNISRYSGSAC